MHEKIIATIYLNYPDDYDEYLTKEIKTGKNLTKDEINWAIIEFLANTDFTREHALYDYSHEITDEMIFTWLNLCKEEYEKLTIEEPSNDEYLDVGTFKSDHKYAGYAALQIIYQRRYLENE